MVVRYQKPKRTQNEAENESYLKSSAMLFVANQKQLLSDTKSLTHNEESYIFQAYLYF